MSGKSSRRDFLVTASLAGAALAAGAAAGCAEKKAEQEVVPVQAQQRVHVDTLGRLVVDDPALADTLNEVWKKTAGSERPNPGQKIRGITVMFDTTLAGAAATQSTEPKGQASRTGKPSTSTGIQDIPSGKQINSLCFCGPQQ